MTHIPPASFEEHWQGELSDADFSGIDRRARPGESFDKARLCVPLFYTRVDIQWRAEIGESIVVAALDGEESGRVGQRVQQVLPPNTVPTCRLEIYDADLAPAFDSESQRFHLTHEQTTYARRLVLSAIQKLGLVTSSAPVVLAARLERFLPEEDLPHWTSRDTIACNYGLAPIDCTPSELARVGTYRERSSWVIDKAALQRWATITQWWPSNGSCDLLLDYFSMGVIDLSRDHRKAFIFWSIMFELMFGAGVRTRLSQRMSRRAANLSVDSGDDAYEIARSWYRVRSQLLHEARDPTPEAALRFGLYMKQLLAHYLAALDCVGGVHLLRQRLDEGPLRTAVENFEARTIEWSNLLSSSS
jgi:hypothetical protein